MIRSLLLSLALATSLVATASAGLALLAFGELQAWRASRADYPAPSQRRTGPPDGIPANREP